MESRSVTELSRRQENTIKQNYCKFFFYKNQLNQVQCSSKTVLHSSEQNRQAKPNTNCHKQYRQISKDEWQQCRTTWLKNDIVYDYTLLNHANLFLKRYDNTPNPTLDFVEKHHVRAMFLVNHLPESQVGERDND